jgi:hypothetical protein
MKPPFGDVPLKHAMIAWTPMQDRLAGTAGRIVIIPYLNDDRDWFKYFGVTDSTGACWAQWEKWTKQQRLLKLYIEAWHIIARDGISPEAVHAAFMVIPEYRESLSGETFFSNDPCFDMAFLQSKVESLEQEKASFQKTVTDLLVLIGKIKKIAQE